MNETTCPSCGHPMPVDALTGEARPCTRCGSTRGMSSEKPVPDPEHQQRIKKSKGFEIAAVVVMILVGLTFVSIRGGTSTDDTSASLISVSNVIGAHDYEFSGESTLRGRKFLGYRKREGVFQKSIHLIANDESDALEAVLIVVAHPGGRPFPPDEVAEAAIQESLGEVVRLSGEMIPSFFQALENAAMTMTEGRVGVSHRKGVSQTGDGWKVTYVIYREYEETGEDIPLLLFFYQRLSAASDPELAEFNGIVFEAINEGLDPVSSLGGG